jgi:hypothetical protein
VGAAGILRPLLFEFAEHDFYLAPMVELEFRRAVGETAELRRYPGGHDVKVDAARDDRRIFLARVREGSGYGASRRVGW